MSDQNPSELEGSFSMAYACGFQGGAWRGVAGQLGAMGSFSGLGGSRVDPMELDGWM